MLIGLFVRNQADPALPLVAVADTGFSPAAPQGTTLAETLLAGPAGPGGYRPIVPAPGEPYLLREELASRPVKTTVTAALGTAKRTPIVAFAHLTTFTWWTISPRRGS